MSNLINVRTARNAFGQTHILHEAMRRIGVAATGKRNERLYDREALAEEIKRLQIAGWRKHPRPEKRHTTRNRTSDGRWRPDHPGTWTEEDMAEFNRRHPFRSEYIAGFVGLLSQGTHRTSKCRGKE